MIAEVPLTAAQIYEQLTGRKGIQPLSEAQSNATELFQRMNARAMKINDLRAKTLHGWQGKGGDSASDATAPLVQAAMDDAIHLHNAQTAVGAQMDAFSAAKNSVKPVAAKPPEITTQDAVDVLTGRGFGGYNTRVASWQADSQANIDAFSAYHAASTANGAQMPAEYARLNDSSAPIALDTQTPASNKTTDTGQRTQQPRQPGQTQNRPVTQTGQNQTGQNQVGGWTPGPNTPTTPSTSDVTHANSFVPQPVVPPAASSGYQFGPTGQPINSPGPGGGFGPYGTGEFGPGTGYMPGSGPGSGSGGGYGAGGGYRGTGSGAAGEPGARGLGAGAGSGRGAVGESVAGGRAGAPGAAGGRGANGMPMGAAGAGKGQKEEDKEKKAAAYLRNPDPDETFGGTEEKPMPPVIGETRRY